VSGKHALQTRKLNKDSDNLISLSAQDDPSTEAYKVTHDWCSHVVDNATPWAMTAEVGFHF